MRKGLRGGEVIGLAIEVAIMMCSISAPDADALASVHYA